MNVAAAKVPAVLLSAAGEPPLGLNGMFFSLDQGEIFEHDNPRYRSPATLIGVIELANGKWLARPPGLMVDGVQHESRQHALRAGIAALIRRARKYARSATGEGTHWEAGYAGRIIEWALSLKPAKQQDVAGEPAKVELPGSAGTIGSGDAPMVAGSPAAPITEQRYLEASYTACEAIDAGAEISDPVVRILAQEHEKRRAFPAKHTFSMTTEVADGRIVSIATCKCGHVIKFGANDYVRMNAAIEAHWRRFPWEPCVDGMGKPIKPGDMSKIKANEKEYQRELKQRKRKRKSSDGRADEAKAREPVAVVGAVRDQPDDDRTTMATAQAGMGSERPSPSEANIQDAYLAGITARMKIRDTDVADMGAASVPAPVVSSLSAGAGEIVDGQICPTSESAVATRDDVPADWSPLLRAATEMAWQEVPAVIPISRQPGEPSRPVLRWHGGKWKLAPWVIGHFPPHKVYVEPFGGAASVLLRKPPALTEVYNDLDCEVVNLFRVLRSEASNRLLQGLRLTVFAREEFDQSFEESADPVERARRLIVRSFFSGGSRGVLDLDRASAGFNSGSARSRAANAMASHAKDWSNYADCLPAIIERFREVVIENKPAVDLIEQHDSVSTLFYVDPPYLSDVRSDRARKAYRHELSDEQHIELLTILKDLEGMVVLSGYPHPLYDDSLHGWRRVEIGAYADGARERTEVLWINPRCSAALDAQHPALFDIAALDAANSPPQRT